MSPEVRSCDVLVVGAGASGVCAAIAAAELGAGVIVTEETGWVGGMLTAAGVSAIDGNHTLPSGLWGRFRARLRDHYGGADALATGWISHTLFEPQVAQVILREMLDDTGATVLTGHRCVEALVEPAGGPESESGLAADVNAVRGGVFADTATGARLRIEAGMTIAADEYGDFVYLAGLPFRVGLEARAETREPWAPEEAYPVPQDLTYVATLTAPDPGTLPSGTAPNPGEAPRRLPSFPDILNGTDHSWRDFFSYARLPGKLFMLNWPIHGNDYLGDYLGLEVDAAATGAVAGSSSREPAPSRAARLEAIRRRRTEVLAAAKAKTRRLIAELQATFPASGIAIAPGAYPTTDGLPPLPYIREARRIIGDATLTLRDIADPYQGESGNAEVSSGGGADPRPLYRRAVAVGNYPVDHHRLEDPEAPTIDFPAIPSFSIPVDVLIPRGVTGLLAAEKSISVSGLANGCTRLQPVAMELGEAAGVLAALAAGPSPEDRAQTAARRRATPVADPRSVAVPALQNALLARDCMVLPFSDATPEDPDFRMLQRAGLRGILWGAARSVGWENHTLLRPDEVATTEDIDTAFAEEIDIPAARATVLRRRLHEESARGALSRRELARFLLSIAEAARRSRTK